MCLCVWKGVCAGGHSCLCTHVGPGLPLIVSVTEGSDRDGEGLPHWVQSVLHHFSLVADSKPGDQQRFKMPQEKNRWCCKTVLHLS